MAATLRTRRTAFILRDSAPLISLSRGRGPRPLGLYVAALAARCGCDAATVARMQRDAVATDRRPPL
jgi:hypothetical protein